MYNLSTIYEYKRHNKNSPLENLLYYTEESIYMESIALIALASVSIAAIIGVIIWQIVKHIRGGKDKNGNTVASLIPEEFKKQTTEDLKGKKEDTKIDFKQIKDSSNYKAEYFNGTSNIDNLINSATKIVDDGLIKKDKASSADTELSTLRNNINSLNTSINTFFINLSKNELKTDNNFDKDNCKNSDDYDNTIKEYKKKVVASPDSNEFLESKNDTIKNAEALRVKYHNNYIYPYYDAINKFLNKLTEIQKKEECTKGYYDDITDNDAKQKVQKYIEYYIKVCNWMANFFDVQIAMIMPLIYVCQSISTAITNAK